MQYCGVCRRNDSKKHMYTAGHGQRAEAFLAKQIAKTTSLLDRSREPPFWCVFCDCNVEDLKHLASKDHITTTRKFCKQHRCQFDAKLAGEPIQEAATPPVCEEVSIAPVENPRRDQLQTVFLNSVTQRLEQRVAKTAVKPKPLEKNVVSNDGIVQNPSGFNAESGDRAWGGGIVKLPKKDLVPWPIDELVHQLLNVHFNVQKTTPELEPKSTDIAFGPGLSSIKRSWHQQSVHNIHSNAIPPWMVASKEEYYTCNARSSKEWLPKFGGVWEAGPRSQTMRSFKSHPSSQRAASMPPIPAASSMAPAPLPPLDDKTLALARQKQHLREKMLRKNTKFSG